MNIEEIKAMFSTAYKAQKSKLIPPVTNCVPNTPCKFKFRHHIYSYEALPELFSILKQIEIDTHDSVDDQLNRFSVRFVVDELGTIWFGQEGPTGPKVPNHREMLGFCRAAGNIYFSDDYKHITRITNKSGHFKPNPDTLVWAVAALRSLNAAFAESVSLELITDELSTDVTILSPNALLSLLPNKAFQNSRRDFLIRVTTQDSVEELTSAPNPAPLHAEQEIKRLFDSFSMFNSDTELNEEDEHVPGPKRMRGQGLFVQPPVAAAAPPLLNPTSGLDALCLDMEEYEPVTPPRITGHSVFFSQSQVSVAAPPPTDAAGPLSTPPRARRSTPY